MSITGAASMSITSVSRRRRLGVRSDMVAMAGKEGEEREGDGYFERR